MCNLENIIVWVMVFEYYRDLYMHFIGIEAIPCCEKNYLGNLWGIKTVKLFVDAVINFI